MAAGGRGRVSAAEAWREERAGKNHSRSIEAEVAGITAIRGVRRSHHQVQMVGMSDHSGHANEERDESVLEACDVTPAHPKLSDGWMPCSTRRRSSEVTDGVVGVA